MAGTVVKIKQSSVANKVPSASDLEQGELALNTADVKLYSKNAAGAIITLAAGATTVDHVDIVDFGDVNRDVIYDGGSSTGVLYTTHGAYDGGEA
jgi:hypothetical protein|tara:strand:+ start:30309 stop:30593 length:285 start_codon:yes stop_codon:yes gene_type:complete